MVLFIAQVILGVLVVVYQDEARDTGKKTMIDVFEHYNVSQDEALADTIDTMQSDVSFFNLLNIETKRISVVFNKGYS